MISSLRWALMNLCARAGLVVEFGRPFAKCVNAAIDIRVGSEVEPIQGIDYGERFMAGCGVVEINQRRAVYSLFEYGEILPDAMNF